MNIVIAAALLILLLIHAGRMGKTPRKAAEKNRPDAPDWIDELEILDAATDDFV